VIQIYSLIGARRILGRAPAVIAKRYAVLRFNLRRNEYSTEHSFSAVTGAGRHVATVARISANHQQIRTWNAFLSFKMMRFD